MNEPDELGATNARLTFRTFKVYVEKLRVVAEAHGLLIDKRPSVGAALNMIIGKYDDSTERAKARKKKGSKR